MTLALRLFRTQVEDGTLARGSNSLARWSRPRRTPPLTGTYAALRRCAVPSQTPLPAHLPEVAVPHRPGVDEPVALEDEMGKLLLTPVEAASALGIGRSKLYELIQTGQLPSVRIGTCRRVPTEALHDFLLTLRTTA